MQPVNREADPIEDNLARSVTRQQCMCSASASALPR
jgi:hypothetical protein